MARDAVELRETHISWVLLPGDRAYKVKKPRPAPVPRLRHARAPAPSVPRGGAAEPPPRARASTSACGRSSAPTAACGSAPERRPGAVEYAVEMRRYDEDATLARRLAAGTASGRTRSRRSAPRSPPFTPRAAGRPTPERAVAAFEAMLSENFATLRELHAGSPRDRRRASGFAAARARRSPGTSSCGARGAGLRARRPRRPARRARRCSSAGSRSSTASSSTRALREIDVGLDLAFLVMDLPAARRAARRARSSRPTARPAATRATTRCWPSSPPSGRWSGRRSRSCAPASSTAPTPARRRRATPSRCSRSRERLGWRVADRAGSRRLPGRPPAASRRSRRRSPSGPGRRVLSSDRRPQGARWVSRRRRGRPRAPTSRPSTAGPTRRSAAGARADRRRRARDRRRDVPPPGRPRGVPGGARRRRAHVARVPRPRRGARTAGRRADAGSRTRLGCRPRRRGPPGRGVAAAGRGPGHRGPHRSAPGRRIGGSARGPGCATRRIFAANYAVTRGWGPDGVGLLRPYGRFMPLLAPTVDVALRDGSTVRVRPMVAEDEPALRAFLDELSVESRWLRFFSGGADVHRAAVVHGGARARAGPRPGRGRRRAGADRRPRRVHPRAAPGPRRGRVRGRRRLAGPRDRARCCSPTCPSSRPPRASRRSPPPCSPRTTGWSRCSATPASPSRSESRPGELRVELPAALGDEARARFEERDAVAAAAAVAHVLRPASVAVIGVSTPRGLGRRGGAAQPARGRLPAAGSRVVHPREATVGGVPAHRSIADVPEPVELAVDRRSRRGRRGRRARVRRRRRARARRALGRLRRGRTRAVATARPSCSPSAAPAGCGSSARTASACSTPPRRRR